MRIQRFIVDTYAGGAELGTRPAVATETVLTVTASATTGGQPEENSIPGAGWPPVILVYNPRLCSETM